MTDPMEKIVRDALEREGFNFVEDGKPGGADQKHIYTYSTPYRIYSTLFTESDAQHDPEAEHR